MLVAIPLARDHLPTPAAGGRRQHPQTSAVAVDGDPLVDEAARDWAVRDYRRHLKAVERFKPLSVNLALAALDSFYTHEGLGTAMIRREKLPATAPRALSEEQ